MLNRPSEELTRAKRHRKFRSLNVSSHYSVHLLLHFLQL